MPMSIHCIGLNHKTADINLRERVAFSEDDLGHFLQKHVRSDSLHRWNEMVVLSTCNRVEFYAVTDHPEPPELIDQVASYFHLPMEILEPMLYRYIDEQAAGHLFRVASGLDSMVIGEPEILGQVTQAYEFARRQGKTGKTISRLFQAAAHTGKRVRSETAIGTQSVSVPSLAAKLIAQKVKDLQTAKVVLLGAGEMAELAIEALRKRNVDQINVINRSLSNACKLAERWQGEAGSLDTLPERLTEADALITSTSSPYVVIEEPLIAEVMRTRSGRQPLIIVDIAVPRDVSPTVAKIANVHLYDIDSLDAEVKHSLKSRAQEIPKAEEIILHELGLFIDYQANEKVFPLIVEVRQQADQIRQMELRKALRRMPALDNELQNQVERLTKSIVNKILHNPTTRLKEEATGSDLHTYASVVQSLFGLEDIQNDFD